MVSSKLVPLKSNPILSVCIPAYNEEENIGKTIDAVSQALISAGIPYEFVIANDNSTDATENVIRNRMEAGIPIRLVNRIPPGGFGRAIRSCLSHFQGDIVVVVMADLSDDPADIIKYYKKMNEGYDAVFGSRFMAGAVVKDYPTLKLIANRLGNWLIQVLFRTKHNDLTNAFKAYRGEAIRSIMPFYSSHFNITIEISVGLLTRGFKIAAVPVNWYGRTWGQANFKIKTLGRRYIATLTKLYAERIFIHDDIMSEHASTLQSLQERPEDGEQIITNITDENDSSDRRSRFRGI